MKKRRQTRYQINRYLIKGIFIFLSILSMVLVISGILEQPVLFTSLASTTFLIFVRPESKTSQYRNVIGGHYVSATVGFLIAISAEKAMLLHDEKIMLGLICALSVAAASILMHFLDMEHPPAAGTALAFAFGVRSADMLVTLGIALSTIIFLACLKIFLHGFEKLLMRYEHNFAKELRRHLFHHRI